MKGMDTVEMDLIVDRTIGTAAIKGTVGEVIIMLERMIFGNGSSNLANLWVLSNCN